MTYDYIINGAGAAGLSLAVHMIRSGKFTDKNIVILEKSPKILNDRTWCFWENNDGPFENLVHHAWDKLWFHGDSGKSALHDIAPWKYKLIRGIDFYNYCFNLIDTVDYITIKYGVVQSCTSDYDGTYVVMDDEKLHARFVFNSISSHPPALQHNEIFLLQHFKGWVIKTPRPAFDPREATLMDFRVPQQHGTTFVYVMPFSETAALVEYTLFSERVLDNEQYIEGLKHYCREILRLEEYEIAEQEFGKIPMTSYRFPRRHHHIINIGIAGGQTKASSGYTFKFIQQHSAALTAKLIRTGNPFLAENIFRRRFHLYDAALLNVLAKHRMPGSRVFTTLMETNSMHSVMRFLDNETSLQDELRIIRKLPRGIFARAFAESAL